MVAIQHERNTDTALQFFGSVSASISHEIKNTLAIINESAGLMQDLLLMAQRGAELSPERLQKQAAAIQKQVQRANTIVQNMNRFAHSADHPCSTVELGESLELMAALATRLAQMRSAAVSAECGEAPLTIVTVPFWLNHLLWRCIHWAVDRAAGEKQIQLKAEKTDGGVRVHFILCDGFSANSVDGFPSSDEQALLERLAGDLMVHGDRGEVVITLPAKIGE